jgi:hypothetical protein
VALPVAHMALAARVVSKTLDSLAADLGLSRLAPVHDRSVVALPASMAAALSPAAARATPPVVPRFKSTSRVSPHGSPLAAGFASEPTAGLVRIGVMNLEKTNP